MIESRNGGVLLILLAGTLAYLNSFNGVPQYDDFVVFVDNPAVASVIDWWHSMPGTRPLLKLSFALNLQLGGLFGLHLVNLALHLLNATLVLLLLRHLLPSNPGRVALVGALLFVLHPVNTEAVTMLSGRSVALATSFVLGSLVAQLVGRTALSLLLFVAALASRETSLMLPALLTLSTFYRGLHDPERSAAVALRSAVVAARWHWLLAIAGLLAIAALPRYRELLLVSLDTRAPLPNLITQAHATLYLLGQLFQPFALNADPRLAVFEGWELRWLPALAFWTVALAWSLARIGRGSWLAFALLWFVIAISPSNSLLARLDVANERHLYLAAIPLYAVVGLLSERLWRGMPRPGRALIGMLCGILFAATVLRNEVYGSEASFWGAAVAADAGNARAWNNLGYALEQEQPEQAAAALAAYDRAIVLDPKDYKAQFNRMRLCESVMNVGVCEAGAAQRGRP